MPPALHLEWLVYTDSAGMILSLANLLLLRQSMPTRRRLQVWDRPVSRILDAYTFNTIGMLIVGVWWREEHPAQ
ncbi:MAG: hypothetical protein ABSE53_09520 [Terracidiphilus sp.]